MRLLHLSDVEKLTLTDFNGKPIPPYAILSHCWGDNEILFEDLVNDRYNDKAGYRKIEFCAKQAARDQLQYFWIDTCCIDKWNLRELSEAINSMFRWYRNATKCYVFLVDVSVPTVSYVPQDDTWEASFVASRWFTRGWTLQELIAPVSVEFFSSEGYRLGDKTSLQQLIHAITGIPVKALHGYSLENFSTSDRIEWARNRDTTEPENNAYCLLGILNVLMRTSYGEGKENALRRLYNELEVSSAAPCNIPFSQNLHFIGRESQLAALEAQLFTHKQTTTIAVSGAGGNWNRACSVFWVDAGDIDSIHHAYFSIAQQLDIPGWDDRKADLKQLVKQYLSSRTTQQWLLIFDNVDGLDIASTGLSTPSSANLIDYLPQSHLGSVVFTTASSDVAETLASRNVVELQVMTPDDARRMFEDYATSIPTSERQEMKLLLEELSYIPLAILQAAAYIKTKRITIKEYRSRLLKQRNKNLELIGDLPKDKLQDSNTQEIVALTLLVSLAQIHQNHHLAASYLFLTACVDRKDIPLVLFRADSLTEKEDAIRILDDYGLATRRPAESAIDVHRLVHFTVQKWLQKQGWLDQWVRNAVKSLLGVFPNNHYESRSKWRRLLQHAKYTLSYSLTEQDDENRTDLEWRYAIALRSDGRFNESEGLFSRVTESRKTKLGFDHPDTLSSMANLASTYGDQGRWKEAEQLEVQVMETRKTKLGADHPDTLTSMNNLAMTYVKQCRWKEAEQLQKQVIEMSKTRLGADHPNTVASIANLASTYRN